MSSDLRLHQLLDDLHASLDGDGLYAALENYLHESSCAQEYAIYFRDQHSGELELFHCSAEPHSFDADQLNSLSEACNLNEQTTAIPLSYQNDPYGLLLLWKVASVDEAQLLLARTLGTALIKQQLYDQAGAESFAARTKMETVNAIAELLHNLDLDVLLARLLEISLEVMKAQVGSILLYREGELHSEVEWGLRGEFLLALQGSDGTPFIAQTIESGNPLLISDVAADGRIDTGNFDESLTSLICIPLITKTQTLGALTIVNNEGEFDQNDFETLTTLSLLSSSAVENSLLQQSQVETDRIKQQMNLACDIQDKLHAHATPAVAGLDFDGWCLPCDETGGDYFDFVQRGNGEVGVVIGDASGHGLGAAMMMVGVRASLLTALQSDSSLPDVFYRVNDRSEIDSEDDRFMTLFCGFFAEDRRSLNYCSAGHDQPLWYRPSTDSFTALEATGIPLGVIDDFEFGTDTIEGIEKGDIIIFATDGVWEAFDADRTAFGIEGLQKVIRANHQLPAVELGSTIRRAVLNHIGTAPRTDDITLIVAKIT